MSYVENHRGLTYIEVSPPPPPGDGHDEGGSTVDPGGG